MDAERRRRYAELSTRLAYLDDAELASLVPRTPLAEQRAWGDSGTVELDGTKLFVKRIPVTDVEQRHRFSTKNHFRLPPHYSYGVGSAGFGAFRELAMHVKTTGWVLDGAIDGFPLLLHHRLMPRRPARPHFDVERYGRYWGGSRSIVRYAEARAAATAEIWLVLEHVPHPAGRWLLDHQSDVAGVIDQVSDTVSFLRGNGVVHFDVHGFNVVTDGTLAHLADFGLALDREFALADREREFLAAHAHYDVAEAIWSLTAGLLFSFYENLDADGQAALMAKYVPQGGRLFDLVRSLLGQLDRAQHDGDLPLHDEYVTTASRYLDVALLYHDFYVRLTSDPRKKVRWDDAAAVPLLERAGVPTG